MSKKRKPESTLEKLLMDCIDNLSQKHEIHKVWRDFISLTACSISNTVDHVNRDAREKEYKTTISSYEKTEIDMFAQMFALTVSALEENPRQDFLGSIFMKFQLGNSAKGQHFTPYHIAEFMGLISQTEIEEDNQLREKGYITVNDPACGAGVMFIAFANVLQEAGINYQTQCLFVAEDIDLTAAQMCYIQMSLLGCPGYVICHNSLFPEKYESGQFWFTPFYYTEIWHQRRQLEQIKDIFRGEYPNEPDPSPGGDAA